MKKSSKYLLMGGACAIALALCTSPLHAQILNNAAGMFSSENDAAVASALEGALGQDRVTVKEVSFNTKAYRPVYAALSWQPMWVGSHGLNHRAEQALKVIAQANEEGLAPESYALPAIYSLQNAHSLKGQTDPQTLAELDLLVSRAVLTYAHDLRYGATSPARKLLGGFAATEKDSDGAILESAYASGNIAGFLHAQAPTLPEYTGLKKLLADYRTLSAQGGWPAWSMGRAIKPGDTDARVPALRTILAATQGADVKSASPVYDEALQREVARFQALHGLNETGIVNAATQKALSIPIEERTEQIVATLERVRWMPRDDMPRHIIVNVPAYQLHAYENDRETLSMRVIVGKQATATPQFSDTISEVIFNPTWSPTASIVRKEMLPKLKSNPDYFVRANFTVYQNGEEVDPHNVNVEDGDIRFRQSSGDGNALGKIKFNLPDTDDIYMHSTATPALFANDERSLSHGCVRLEKPRELAHFVMNGMDGWDAAKIDASYDDDTTKHVKVPPVAVHLVYWTVWVDADGTAHFYNDIYHTDEGLSAKLEPKADGVTVAAN